MIRNTLFFLLLTSAAAGGGDPYEEGMRLYADGKYKEAFESFKKAIEKNQNPPAELYYNKAVAAFQIGDDHEAEASAEKAAASGERKFTNVRDFLRGNIAFRRCENIEKEIDDAKIAPPAPQPPGAPPSAPPDPVAGYERAIAQAESARDAWIAAAAGEPAGVDTTKGNATKSNTVKEAGAAARNVERAILKIEELKKKKEEAEKQQKEQQKKDDKNKDDNNKKDENKPESRPESRPDSRPESRPDQEQKQDPQKNEDQKKQDQQNQQNDPNQQKQDQKQQDPKESPEEQDPNKLTQAQIQRMLDKLDDKEKQRQAVMKAKARVVRVPKDW